MSNQNIFNVAQLCEQARAKHIEGETAEAIGLLTQAIRQEPSNTQVAMDMVQIFIDIGELEQATALFNQLPASDREGGVGTALLGQLTIHDLAAKTDGKEVLQARIGSNENDNEARFDLAICLVAEHDYQEAMENLFAVIKSEPEFKEGAAREMIVSLSNILETNEPELSQRFRRRLANTLS